jgi:hypothetical protein
MLGLNSNDVKATSLAGTEMTAEEYAFINWIAEHRRFYGTKEEYEFRFQNFKKAYEHVSNHDARTAGFELELNKFADLTPEEFKSYLGAKKPDNFKDTGMTLTHDTSNL